MGGIDVVVKKPGGSSTISLVRGPNGYVLQGVVSDGTPAEIQMLRQVGPLVAGLLTGQITNATITSTANGQLSVRVTQGVNQRAVATKGISGN